MSSFAKGFFGTLGEQVSAPTGKQQRTPDEELYIHRGKKEIDQLYKDPIVPFKQQLDLKRAGAGKFGFEQEKALVKVAANIKARSFEQVQYQKWQSKLADGYWEKYEKAKKETSTKFGPGYKMGVPYRLVGTALGNKWASASLAGQWLSDNGYGWNKARIGNKDAGHGEAPNGKFYQEPHYRGKVTKEGAPNGGFQVEGRREKFATALARRDQDFDIAKLVSESVQSGKSNPIYGITGRTENGVPVINNAAVKKAYDRYKRYIEPYMTDKFKQLKLYTEDTKNLNAADEGWVERKDSAQVHKDVLKTTSSVDKVATPLVDRKETTQKFTPLDMLPLGAENDKRKAIQSDVVDIVRKIAKEEGVTLNNNHIKVILATIRGESSFNPEAVGDGGNSVGLGQINMEAHFEVLGLDPRFATEQDVANMEQKLKDPEFNIRFLLTKANNGGAFKNKGFMQGKNLEAMNKALVAKTMITADIPGDTSKRLQFAREFGKSFKTVKREDVKIARSASVSDNNTEVRKFSDSPFEQTARETKKFKEIGKTVEGIKKYLSKNDDYISIDSFNPEMLQKTWKAMGRDVPPGLTESEDITKYIVKKYNSEVEDNKPLSRAGRDLKAYEDRAHGPIPGQPRRKVMMLNNSHKFLGVPIPTMDHPEYTRRGMNKDSMAINRDRNMKAAESRIHSKWLLTVNDWLKNLPEDMPHPTEKDNNGKPTVIKNWGGQFREKWLAQNKNAIIQLMEKLDSVEPLARNGVLQGIDKAKYDVLLSNDTIKKAFNTAYKSNEGKLNNPKHYNKTTVLVNPTKDMHLYSPISPVDEDVQKAGGYHVDGQYVTKSIGGQKEFEKFDIIRTRLTPMFDPKGKYFAKTSDTPEQKAQKIKAFQDLKDNVVKYAEGDITAEQLETFIRENPVISGEVRKAGEAKTLKQLEDITLALASSIGHSFRTMNTHFKYNGALLVSIPHSKLQDVKETTAKKEIIKEQQHIINNSAPIKMLFKSIAELLLRSGIARSSVAEMPDEVRKLVRTQLASIMEKGKLQNSEERSILEQALAELKIKATPSGGLSGDEQKEAQRDHENLQNFLMTSGATVTADVATLAERMLEKVNSFFAGFGKFWKQASVGSVQDMIKSQWDFKGKTIKNHIGIHSDKSGADIPGWYKSKNNMGKELQTKWTTAQKDLDDAMNDKTLSSRGRYIAQMAAQRTFFAIQLTYQYAGMVQGGSGGRAISNEDFQNLYRALWGGTGELTLPRLKAAQAVVMKSIANAKGILGLSGGSEALLKFAQNKVGAITDALYMTRFKELQDSFRDTSGWGTEQNEKQMVEKTKFNNAFGTIMRNTSALMQKNKNMFRRRGQEITKDYVDNTPMNNFMKDIGQDFTVKLDKVTADSLSTQTGLSYLKEGLELSGDKLLMVQIFAGFKKVPSLPAPDLLRRTGITDPEELRKLSKVPIDVILERGFSKHSPVYIKASKGIFDNVIRQMFRIAITPK